MYRVQIEVTTRQSEWIHLERESYSKAEECRLLLGTKRVVATIEAILPPEGKLKGPGRKRAANRRVINGRWYVLETGCQWKAVHRDWFGVCSTTLHHRFQEWQRMGVFERLMQEFVKFYGSDGVSTGLGKPSIASRVRSAGWHRHGQKSS